MKAPHLATVGGLLLVALVAGCQSPRAARIREKATLFATLDPFTRELIEKGLFNYGFTSELLFMSLGKPDRVVVTDSLRGPVETWVYSNFLYESSPAVKVGVSAPGSRPLGTVVSSSSPLGGPSLNSTKAGPGQAAVDEDTSLCTVYLDLLDDRVVAVRIKK